MGEFNLSISYVESHSAESDKKPYAQDDLHDSKWNNEIKQTISLIFDTTL